MGCDKIMYLEGECLSIYKLYNYIDFFNNSSYIKYLNNIKYEY